MQIEPWQFNFKALGGGCEIRIFHEDKDEAIAKAEAAIAEVDRIEKKYSRYRADSIVSQINQAAGTGQWIGCDPETRWLFDYADTLYRNSNGLFDITSGILRRAWNFQQAQLPDEATLASLLPLIDWNSVERDGNRIRLPRAGMEIDFGGFGKEYASDSSATILSNTGVRHGYVNLGGDIAVIGPQQNGRPWLIGIQDPRRQKQIIATIPMEKGGLATSGDYEKFFEMDGRRYCHIIHPTSGHPVNYWRSITVQAPLSIAAGSYSTIAMLLEERALDFLAETGFDYLAIDMNGQIFNARQNA